MSCSIRQLFWYNINSTISSSQQSKYDQYPDFQDCDLILLSMFTISSLALSCGDVTQFKCYFSQSGTLLRNTTHAYTCTHTHTQHVKPCIANNRWINDGQITFHSPQFPPILWCLWFWEELVDDSGVIGRPHRVPLNYFILIGFLLIASRRSLRGPNDSL